MRLLVVGAGGLVGSNVVSEANARGWETTGTYYTESPALDVELLQLDIRNTGDFVDILEGNEPDAVLNCAAMTDVDACEDRESAAFAINGDAPKEMADACATRSISFCHLSTDYVFDGRSDLPYVETDAPNPIQTYGASKLAGERGVREVHPEPLVCRLSFVYGIHQGRDELVGFPRWLRERLQDGTETPLFTDQYVSPTRAGHAAGALLELLRKEAQDTYHIAARDCVTPYEFGTAIARRIEATDLRTLLLEGSREAVDRAADRPRNSCLDVSRIESKLGRPQPTIEEDLDAISGAL